MDQIDVLERFTFVDYDKTRDVRFYCIGNPDEDNTTLTHVDFTVNTSASNLINGPQISNCKELKSIKIETHAQDKHAYQLYMYPKLEKLELIFNDESDLIYPPEQKPILFNNQFRVHEVAPI